MPTRVIRGEINASDSLSAVSMQADLTFRALIVACDDFGRIDGRLPALKALLFPLREEVTTKKLDAWLDELAAGPDAPIVRYVVDGRPYVALTGWEKHRGQGRRGKTSKCPEPLPRKSEEVQVNPPGNRESGDENRETGDEGRSAEAAAPPRTRGSGKPRKTRVPDQLSTEDRARVQAWAAKQRPPITTRELEFGWAAYLSKARANGYAYEDHARAFMNAIGACGEAWALKGYTSPGGSSAGATRYRSADEVLAEAKRKQAADDARRANESPESIGQLIDLSLRQASGGAA